MEPQDDLARARPASASAGSPTARYPGESAGVLNDPQHWRTIGQATLSYGYGVAVTAVAARARVLGDRGGRHRCDPCRCSRSTKPPAGERVISASTARELTRHARGRRRRRPAPASARPCATTTSPARPAPRRRPGSAATATERHGAIFAGFAPASAAAPRRRRHDRRAAGRSPTTARDVAAPVFANIVSGALRVLAVPPDALPAPALTVRRASAGEAMMAALAARDRTLGELLGAGAGGYARLAITDLTLDSRAGHARRRVRRASRARREHGLALRGRGARARRGDRAVRARARSTRIRRSRASPCPSLKARLGELARAFFATRPAPTLVGVTGTNGKTTVAYLTRAGARSTAASVRLHRHARLRRAAEAHAPRAHDAGHASRCTASSRSCARRASRWKCRRTRSRRTGSRASRSTRPCSRISRAIISTSTATSRATATRSAGCSSCRVLQYAVVNVDDSVRRGARRESARRAASSMRTSDRAARTARSLARGEARGSRRPRRSKSRASSASDGS